MADYKRMYLALVAELCNTIDSLKAALERAEHIFIETDESDEHD